MSVIDLDLLSSEEADAVVTESIQAYIEDTDDSIDPQAFKAFFEASEYDYDAALDLYEVYEDQVAESHAEPEADPFEEFVATHPEAAADPDFAAMVAATEGGSDLEASLPVYENWKAAQAAAFEKLARRELTFDQAFDESVEEGLIGPGVGKAYVAERNARDSGLDSALADFMDAKGAENALRRGAEAVVRRSIDG